MAESEPRAKRRQKRTRRGWGNLFRRPNGKYYLQYVDAGGVRRMRLAGSSLRDAEAFLRRTREDVERARRGEALRQLTLADWWDEEYLAVVVSRLKPAGVRTAQVHVQRLCDWLALELDDPHIRDVTRADAEDFVAALIGEGLEPSYVRRLVSTIRRAWGDAIVRGLAAENPWAKLKIAPPRPTEVPWVTPEQLQAIFEALPEGVRPHLVLVGETGLRIGEAQALRRMDVDLRAGAERVIVRDGKTAASRRTVPLSEYSVELLRPLVAAADGDHALVLPPFTQQYLRVALKAACAKVGVKPLKVHSLRHVYASHLVQWGSPPSTVARLLGHADGGALVMRLYGRWMPHDAETRAARGMTSWRRKVAPPSQPSAEAPPGS